MSKYKMNPKYTCGDTRANARCVFYDLNVPEFSNIAEEECLTIHETTEDVYKLIEWIKQSIDLEELDPSCFETEKVQDIYFKNMNRFLIKDVIKELRDEVCQIKDTMNDGDPDNLGLDLKCLVAPCGDQITSLKDLLQVLIDEICILKGQ